MNQVMQVRCFSITFQAAAIKRVSSMDGSRRIGKESVALSRPRSEDQLYENHNISRQ